MSSASRGAWAQIPLESPPAHLHDADTDDPHLPIGLNFAWREADLITKQQALLAHAPLNMAILPSSLAVVRTKSGKPWNSVSLAEVVQDLRASRLKAPTSRTRTPGDPSVDDLLAAFLRLNVTDPANQPSQSQVADIGRRLETLKQSALAAQKAREADAAAAQKEAKRRALLSAIRGIEAHIADALKHFNFFLAGQLSVILLDLLIQLAAL